MNTIPSKDRKEWKDLVTGQSNVILKNFFFQMKITQTKNLIAKGNLTIDKAVEEVYNLCVKFSKAKNMSTDLMAIFGEEKIVDKMQQVSNTIIDENNELATHTPKTIDFIKPKVKGTNFVKLEIERIKKEAAEREAVFARRKIELENQLAKERKVREELENKIIIDRKNRIVEEEKKAKEEKKLYKATNNNSQINQKTTFVSEQTKLQKKKDEEKALLKAKASAERRRLDEIKQNKKKRTFFQRLFDF